MSEKNEFPKISIIIPSFNKVKYIGKTLDSINSQKYPNYEVIVRDGGSTDGTVDVIKKYAAKFSAIKWKSEKDKGPVDALNKGLRLSTGKIVAFINADDFYLDGAFNLVRKHYFNNPTKLWFVGKGIVVSESGVENKSLFYRYWVKPYKNFLLKLNLRSVLLCVNYIMQPSVFLKREAIGTFGLFGGTTKFVTEYKKWLDLSAKGMPVVIDNELSAFRMSTTNITSMRTSELLSEDMKMIKRYTKNPLILVLHYLNNLGRLVSLRVI